MLDKAGDFGGTWYWNRYPGCMCDVESYTYLPLLEEVGYMPTKKYAPRPGDLRVRPDARAPLRHVPPRPLPHRGHGHGVGRGCQAVDDHHRSGRPARGALRRHLRWGAAQGEAARHPRHRDLPGPLVPHQPLGLRLHRRRPRGADGQAARQEGRHHRHRRHRRAGRAEARRGGRAPLRVPAHAVVGEPPQPARHRPRVVGRDDLGAGLARAADGELHRHDDRRQPPGRPDPGRLDRDVRGRRQEGARRARPRPPSSRRSTSG